MLLPHELLHASFTDILFQERNRAYGAYQLRVQYPGHLKAALGIVGVCCAMAFAMYFATAGSGKSSGVVEHFIPDLHPPVNIIEPPPAPAPPAVPALQPPALRQLRTEAFTPPLLEPDEQVQPANMPPEQAALENAVIGLSKTAGVDWDAAVLPPKENTGTGLSKGVVVEKAVDDGIVYRVSNEAEFPGGRQGWQRYLERNLRYPEQAVEAGLETTITVQFVIDTEGNISDVVALDNPGFGLAEEAVRIIKNGPKWKPAEQNGKKVKYRQLQRIGFRLQ